MFPIAEILTNFAWKLWEWFVYILWWHTMNRQMAMELYERKSRPKILEQFSKERQWLREHNVSIWVWADYVGGYARCVVLMMAILILGVITRIRSFGV
jgi:hypothetical protein